MEKYFNLLKNNFHKYETENNTQIFYNKKTELEPEELLDMPDALCIFKGLGKTDLNYFKETMESNLSQQNNNFEFPEWYLKFLSKYNGLNYLVLFIAGDENNESYNESPIRFDMLNTGKPSYIDKNSFVIGMYSYQRTPIYANQKGEIFVHQDFDIELSTMLDNKQINKKEASRLYNEYPTPLLAKWDNIETFLIEETQRLTKLNKEMYIGSPIPKETLPNNTGAKLINLSDLSPCK